MTYYSKLDEWQTFIFRNIHFIQRNFPNCWSRFGRPNFNFQMIQHFIMLAMFSTFGEESSCHTLKVRLTACPIVRDSFCAV